jgi:hypothetical protein
MTSIRHDVWAEARTKKKDQTYRFLQIPLNNSKLPLIHRILHNEPTQRLLILAVNLTRFHELSAQLADALLVFLGEEVNDDCVDHICCSVLFCSSLFFLIVSFLDAVKDGQG